MDGKDRILIVDDEDDVLDVLKGHLENAATEVFSANSVKKAMEFLEKEKIDMVVCDIKMPHESGIDFLKKIREMGNEIPFVFLTACGTPENLRSGLMLGAVDFLDKPFTEDVLKRAVYKALEIGRRQKKIDADIDILCQVHKDGEKIKREYSTEKKIIGMFKSIDVKKFKKN